MRSGRMLVSIAAWLLKMPWYKYWLLLLSINLGLVLSFAALYGKLMENSPIAPHFVFQDIQSTRAFAIVERGLELQFVIEVKKLYHPDKELAFENAGFDSYLQAGRLRLDNAWVSLKQHPPFDGPDHIYTVGNCQNMSDGIWCNGGGDESGVIGVIGGNEMRARFESLLDAHRGKFESDSGFYWNYLVWMSVRATGLGVFLEEPRPNSFLAWVLISLQQLIGIVSFTLLVIPRFALFVSRSLQSI